MDVHFVKGGLGLGRLSSTRTYSDRVALEPYQTDANLLTFSSESNTVCALQLNAVVALSSINTNHSTYASRNLPLIPWHCKLKCEYTIVHRSGAQNNLLELFMRVFIFVNGIVP